MKATKFFPPVKSKLATGPPSKLVIGPPSKLVACPSSKLVTGSRSKLVIGSPSKSSSDGKQQFREKVNMQELLWVPLTSNSKGSLIPIKFTFPHFWET